MKALVLVFASFWFFSTASAMAVFCGTKEGRTLMYFNSGKKMVFFNADAGKFEQAYHNHPRYPVGTEILENELTISSYVPDHNFGWRTTLRVDLKNKVVSGFMVEDDEYRKNYNFKLKCDVLRTGGLAEADSIVKLNKRRLCESIVKKARTMNIMKYTVNMCGANGQFDISKRYNPNPNPAKISYEVQFYDWEIPDFGDLDRTLNCDIELERANLKGSKLRMTAHYCNVE